MSDKWAARTAPVDVVGFNYKPWEYPTFHKSAPHIPVIGSETAPSGATEKLFQDAAGKPVSRETGVVGGRSTGAPGVLRMLELAHKEHGKLPGLGHPCAGAAVVPRGDLLG
eukprot:gene440-581_t